MVEYTHNTQKPGLTTPKICRMEHGDDAHPIVQRQH